jgi:hypothetical protein
VNLLESNLNCEFTLIVTQWGTSCGLYADKYRYLSVQKFLQLQSLLDVHVLFAVPEEHHHLVLGHYLKIRAHDVALQSAHFLVKDTESIVDLQLPKHTYSFPKGSVLWQCKNKDGTIQDIRPPSLTYRAYHVGCGQAKTLSSVDGSEILMVKAGINQLSVALLLDTGASDNYMSVRLVKSLGLLVRPDHQGIKVMLADGHQARVTGTVTVPVCIGRFRAKIEFLITDLDASFDAILGYTWLRRNCDLHLSKRMVAFRTGASKVICYKLPPPQKATVPTGRWTHSGLGGARLASSQRAEYAGARRRRLSLTPENAVLPPVDPGQPTFAKACRWVRKGGQAYLLVLKGIEHIRSVGNGATIEALVESLLAEFADVFGDPPGLPPVRNVAHVAPLIPAGLQND